MTCTCRNDCRRCQLEMARAAILLGVYDWDRHHPEMRQ